MSSDWWVHTLGGRKLATPVYNRAAACRSIYDEWLRDLPSSPWAHAFVVGRNCESACAPHRAHRYVMHLDLVQFFRS